jgi:hypothetical protein
VTPDDLIEHHNDGIRRLTEIAMTHLRHENIDEAIARLEEAVAACEKHPAFAKLAASPCKSVKEIVDMCARLASRIGPAAGKAHGLLQRMQVLGRTSIH